MQTLHCTSYPAENIVENLPQRITLVWYLHEPCLNKPFHGAKKQRKLKQNLSKTQREKKLKLKLKKSRTEEKKLIEEELEKMKKGKSHVRQFENVDFIYKKNPRYQHIVSTTMKRLQTEEKEHEEALSIINSSQWEFSE